MAQPLPRARPLSPHLQVWRWHVTLAASIGHRVTGMGLYLAALLFAAWAVALALGRESYQAYMGAMGSWPGRVVLFGLTVCAFFHLATGVRHLFWDFGKGFAPPTANTTAWICFAFAIGATIAVWALALSRGLA
ncbi:MAG TPA: succinate dehydrogenase, cytochrome b556 subunit [Caulobacteraceae bacterium]|nr:succinate dehydrogenase, cytochrome b556 subunit [Caulobacteraceae bacterium]